MTKGNALTGIRCDLEPGNRHLALARCDDCDARWVRHMTLEQVEDWYNRGTITQALYEAYRHCWATGAPRFGSISDGWDATPDDPEVLALVALIRAAPQG